LYAVCFALITASLGAAGPPPQHRGGPVETGPGTLAAARKYLEGRWGLISFEVHPPGEPPIQLKGSGSLKYDQSGNLDVQIRVDEGTAHALEAAGVPIVKGILSTSGRTVIDLQHHTLTYILDGQPAFGAPSGPLALNRPRHWRVEGDVLTLTTKDDRGQPLSIGRWKKTP
jgi:hypothetical protein